MRAFDFRAVGELLAGTTDATPDLEFLGADIRPATDADVSAARSMRAADRLPAVDDMLTVASEWRESTPAPPYGVQHDGQSWRVLHSGVVMDGESHSTFELAAEVCRNLTDDARSTHSFVALICAGRVVATWESQ